MYPKEYLTPRFCRTLTFPRVSRHALRYCLMSLSDVAGLGMSSWERTSKPDSISDSEEDYLLFPRETCSVSLSPTGESAFWNPQLCDLFWSANTPQSFLLNHPFRFSWPLPPMKPAKMTLMGTGNKCVWKRKQASQLFLSFTILLTRK